MSYKNDTQSPIMVVGRYSGKRVDSLPNSYLRWIIGQDFPKAILEAAKKKLEQSDYNDLYLSLSRHAIDMFSKRFLKRFLDTWRGYNGASEALKENWVGLATFMTKLAQEAWDKGTDVSKHRHQDDGIVKEYEGIKWVFHVNYHFPDYKEVITVMSSREE